jgi:isoquinoline 1-oxidoreductase subunit beta
MVRVSRRDIIRAGSALVVGAFLPQFARAAEGGARPALTHDPNAFVRIAPDNSVTVLIKHSEFGQGPYTGLATLVAEELDADWSQMRAESAPAIDKLYVNASFGMQGTGGSSSIANSYLQMRKVGACARAMLVAAAAERWRVPADEIKVERGIVSHGARHASFGELAPRAAKMRPPAEPKLKSPEHFHLIGADLPRLDTPAKSNGAAIFTSDITRRDMVHSAILHPPAFGAKARRVDSADAEALPGVLGVRQISQGIVVFGRSRHAVLQGMRALKVEWDESDAETRSSEQMFSDFARKAREPGAEAETRGAGAEGLASAAKTIEAEYRFPYLAHAPMEPLDAVVEIQSEGVEVWMGSQLQTYDQVAFAKVLGLEPQQVKIHTMMAGGSFGRRATPISEFATEAGAVAKAWGKGSVKHAWTRENDIRGGRYRPLVVHRLRGGLDAQGNIVAWDQTIAAQSFAVGTPWEQLLVKNGVDGTVVEGAKGLPYDVPNLRIAQILMESKVPVLSWRSVGHTHTAYSTETFLDELLVLGKRDPVEGRLTLLKRDDSRYQSYQAVLKRVADMAQWSGATVGQDRARGVALHKFHSTCVAQIAEVSRGADGLPRVHKIWCAIDCGLAVNPDVIRAQMEGGVGFALGAALYSEINLAEGGHVIEGNFDRYRVLRMSEMPEVDVGIIRSTADPLGVGEPPVPCVAPAVANAWRALTGQSVRRLPFARGVLA